MADLNHEAPSPPRRLPGWAAALGVLLLGLLFSLGLLMAGHKAGAFRRWFHSKPPQSMFVPQLEAQVLLLCPPFVPVTHIRA